MTLGKLRSGFTRAVALCAVAALALGICLPTSTAFATEPTAATDQASVLQENTKIATELDENLETNVTLSFPASARQSRLMSYSFWTSRALPRR